MIKTAFCSSDLTMQERESCACPAETSLKIHEWAARGSHLIQIPPECINLHSLELLSMLTAETPTMLTAETPTNVLVD